MSLSKEQMQVSLYAMKGVLSELPEAERKAIEECKAAINAVIDRFGLDLSKIVLGMTIFEIELKEGE